MQPPTDRRLVQGLSSTNARSGSSQPAHWRAHVLLQENRR